MSLIRSIIPRKVSFAENINSVAWKNLIEAIRKTVHGLTYSSSTTSDITVNDSYYFLTVDCSSASRTITLPLAANNKDKQFIFKKLSASNTMTIAANAADTIEGSATAAVTAVYGTIRVISDGMTTWYKI